MKAELQMLRELVWFFLLKCSNNEYAGEGCYFCQGEFLPRGGMTFGHRRHPKIDVEITIHHMDEDRSNNSFTNLVLCHTSCHKSYHAQKRALVRKEVQRLGEEKTLQEG